MLHQSVVNTTACSPSIGSEGLFVEATQRYIPSLDGLRGLSIFLVFGVHGSWSHMQGGSVGVDLFFVLSGFLITQLLVREREKSGTINLTKFYARRFVRLFPPLLLMALCFSIYYFFTYGGRMVWMNLVPALTYISDFTRSRFDSPTAFAHLWSLALEEQFYLAWPLLMLGIAKFAGSSLRLKWCLFILIITINIWRGWLFAR